MRHLARCLGRYSFFTSQVQLWQTLHAVVAVAAQLHTHATGATRLHWIDIKGQLTQIDFYYGGSAKDSNRPMPARISDLQSAFSFWRYMCGRACMCIHPDQFFSFNFHYGGIQVDVNVHLSRPFFKLAIVS